MKKVFGEFKEFIARGNVMNMAVGIIIGGAFTAIVSSLVADIITPIIGMILGGIDFSAIVIAVGSAELGVGKFIQAIINFLLTAIAVFLMVRAVNKLHRKKEEAPAPAPEPAPIPEDIRLLTEIRDLLQNK